MAGDKRYVTWADRADWFFVVGRRPGDRGLTCALVERSEAVVAGGLYDTVGLEGARLGPVRFDRAPIDRSQILGRAGAGMAVFQTAMTHERALVLAFRLGAMGRQLDEAIAFAQRRRVGGRRIASHQAVSHRIARMHARLESARLLSYRAAWSIGRTKRAQAHAALAKWQLAEAAVDGALDAMRLHGGAAYLREAGMADELDDALGGSIHSGTADVLANVVAGWLGIR